MADESGGKTSFFIDLDIKSFTGHAQEAKKTLKEVFETDSMDQFMSIAKTLGPALIAAAGMALALKTALDLTMEGESIKRINEQFEMLTTNAGIAGEALKSGLEKAAKGLIDDTDLIKAANEGIISLGENAAKMPQLLDLATKVTKVFGGESVQRFEQITQAIASGNDRILKHIGLKIDANKAEADYARTLGISRTALTEHEKQTAMLNAVLIKGSSAFKGIKDDNDSVTGTIQRAKIAWKDLAEAIAQVVEKTGFVKGALKAAGDFMKFSADSIKMTFGGATTAAKAEVDQIERLFNEAKDRLHKAKENPKGSGVLGWMFGGPDLTAIQSQVVELSDRLLAAKKKLKDAEAAEPEKEEPKVEKAKGRSEDQIAEERARKLQRMQDQIKFERELFALSDQRIKDQILLEQDASSQLFNIGQERINTEAIYSNKIAELKFQSMGTDARNKEQVDTLIVMLEAEKQLKLQRLREEENDKILKSYDNQLKHATSFFDGFVKASKKASAGAVIDIANFGKRGEKAFDTVKEHSVTAFMQMGEGSKSAGDIMKGFMFGSLGEIAEAEGRLQLTAGLATMNAPRIAGGAALLALAGYLKSQAGASGASSAGSSGGGGAGGGNATPIDPTTLPDKPTGDPVKQKSVTIQVQGNYFETEQTKTRLLDMIRDSTDATDFKYVQIGQR